ncbi:MAG: SDR family NAD(P)-dependent oxidoreductase [Spirochaetales bacterium]|nr:SDR family NAD(P)-dependent oxidoreductase [Spirochaetales bacterium]
MSRYFNQYRLSNISAMIKNNKRDPEECKTRFDKKLVVITGSTSGIGLYTARKYAAMGADLLCINRNREKSEQVCNELKENYDIECSYIIADLSSMTETKKIGTELANIVRPIDVMILNAGIYMTRRRITREGLELVFAVNFMSAFILTYLLKEKFIRQKKGRILYVNSEGHRFCPWGLRVDDLDFTKRTYSGLSAYGSAKLAQLLCLLIFAEEFEGSGVTVNAMHPGAVKTSTGKDNGKFYTWYKKNILERGFRSARISAEALYYLGVSGKVSEINGKFFNLTTVEEPAPPARDREAADKIWKTVKELAHFV